MLFEVSSTSVPVLAEAKERGLEMELKNLDMTLYTDKLAEQIAIYGFPWLKVAVLIQNERGLFLCVHEAKVKQELPDGSVQWVRGDGGWNIPAGRVNIGESLTEAAIREAREETGYDVKLQGIVQMMVSSQTKNPYMIVTFAATAGKNHNDFNREEIGDVAWLAEVEIKQLKDQKKLRSAHLVESAITRCHKNILAPLETIYVRGQE